MNLLMLLFDNYFPHCPIPAGLAPLVTEIMSYLLIANLPGIQYFSDSSPTINNNSCSKGCKVTARTQEHLVKGIQTNIYLWNIFYVQ